MTQQDEFLSAQQVAQILNCHVTQVYKLIKRGKLPKMIKFGEKMSRMRRSELNECLDQMVFNS